MFKKTMVFVAAGVLAVGMAGCTSSNSSSEDISKLEAGFTIQPLSPQNDVDYKTQHVNVSAKNKVEIHLGGSGSCPPVIERAFIEGDKIQLALKDWGDRVCTMDYRPYSQVLSSPSETIDFNKYNFELCDVMGNCQSLIKNYDKVAKA